jgi:hypothetical protein
VSRDIDPAEKSRPLPGWAQLCLIISLATGAFCATGLAIVSLVPPGASSVCGPEPSLDAADEAGCIPTMSYAR